MTEVSAKSSGKPEIKKELTYDDKVLQKIVGLSLKNVSGLLSLDGGFFSNIAEKIVNTDSVTSGVDVEVGKKQVAVDLGIVVEYGKNIPQIFDDIVTVIEKGIEEMTGLELVEVNVNVVDIQTRQQFDTETTTLEDKLIETKDKAKEATDEQKDKAKKAVDKAGKTVKKQVESTRVE